MSIYGHLRTDDVLIDAADQFLAHFNDALKSMKKAESAMLILANHCSEQTVRRHYNYVHKCMVRNRREYARIEHQRELK